MALNNYTFQFDASDRRSGLEYYSTRKTFPFDLQSASDCYCLQIKLDSIAIIEFYPKYGVAIFYRSDVFSERAFTTVINRFLELIDAPYEVYFLPDKNWTLNNTKTNTKLSFTTKCAINLSGRQTYKIMNGINSTIYPMNW